MTKIFFFLPQKKWQLIFFKINFIGVKQIQTVKPLTTNIIKFNGEHTNDNMLVNMRNHFMQRFKINFRLNINFENNLINKAFYQ